MVKHLILHGGIMMTSMSTFCMFYHMFDNSQYQKFISAFTYFIRFPGHLVASNLVGHGAVAVHSSRRPKGSPRMSTWFHSCFSPSKV
ncbi:hypothetical protein EJ110_NYTH26727 [Nymphaea thermarum]|nr:hypothetical protein EJ110_NYTH26727 [Nymphaea thermarum]